MLPDPSEVRLLPPPRRLDPGDDFLSPRGLADWLMCPWMSEQLDSLILPFRFEDHRLLVAWGGCATVLLPRDGTCHLRGRTGEFGSSVSYTRRGPTTVIRGFHDNQTVDYTVDEADGLYRVDGDTGRFRSRYVVGFKEGEAFLAGDHGKFDSNFTARFEADGGVNVQGARNGQPIDLKVRRSPGMVRLEGPFLGSRSDLTLSMGEREWQLAGQAHGDRVEVAYLLVDEGLAVVGLVPPGIKVDFKVMRAEEGYWIRGKVANYHLNYWLLLRMQPQEEGPAEAAAAAEEPAQAEAAAEEPSEAAVAEEPAQAEAAAEEPSEAASAEGPTEAAAAASATPPETSAG